MKEETFRTRFGLIAALLGMAIGTGNIWRFPRVLAENGGGVFLVPWFIFLFLWSIPLLVVEFSLGKGLRRGVASSFAFLTEGRLTWLGSFVVLTSLGIMFYYSVVTGWCLYYMLSALGGSLFRAPSDRFWESFAQGSLWPLLFHAVVLVLAALVIGKGVRKGIEQVSGFMIPVLFLLLIGLACYSLTLPGAGAGLSFIFNTDFARLADHQVWLEALTQSAWSTGAGWGLALSYACYARASDDPLLTPATTGFGNNSAELLAVIVVIPTLFSFFALPQVQDLMEKGNAGLTFVSLPSLFHDMAGGRWLASLFFTALFFAAFTSLMAMFELGVRFLQDLGVARPKAIPLVFVAALVVGTPAALDMRFLDNQDWVWGIGLLVSGFFFSMLVRYAGARRIARDFIGLRDSWGGRIFFFVVMWLIPIEFIVLVAWWFSRAVGWDPGGWWHPFRVSSVGTCLLQWGVLLGVLLLLNRRLYERIKKNGEGLAYGTNPSPHV